ncbi:MAG: hypothetical protein LM575_07540, partial [Caldimicrobium sp.]|nr:hypothetical protein [Caldimicrobium sp.]
MEHHLENYCLLQTISLNFLMNMSEKVYIYDTTLRDGSQAEGVNFSIEDKLRIIKKLDEFGIDYIECGWPGSNPKDTLLFEKLKNIKLNHSKI